MNNEQRQETERKIVRHLIRSMKAKGWDLVWVHDGEERNKVATETEAMEHVFGVDDSAIGFSKKMPTGVTITKTAVIALGNGCDCIADHSCSDRERYPEDDFEEVMNGEVTAYREKFVG